MRRLIEPLLYIVGFTLAFKLLLRLKYAPLVLISVVSNDISIGQRLYLIGLILLWKFLAFIAVWLIGNATRIGIKLSRKTN
ncbi:hypothetical protein [Winogradskyella poriferorum]|uniref:hypothetical protein n=1 Tax=Winogradskyella poriferorum TaxID=307627 RepID=UPI003D64E107